MKGKILDYDFQNSKGVISGDDGNRYYFENSEWKGNTNPKTGQTVDFETDGQNAKGVYLQSSSSVFESTSEKSKIAAGLLAIFLGGLGVHKFYIGCSSAGVIMLVVFFGGIILLGFPTFIISLIGFIEGLIYLFKSDEDFENIYINNKRCWF